jgi:hypothetical protein
MIDRDRRILTALCVLIICVGCAPRFTADLAFQAPKGWVYSAAPNGGEVWVKGGGSNESIMAQATDTPLPQRQPGWKDITICGSQPAVLMVQTNNPGQIWEAVSTTWGSERYMAVYVRPSDAAPDPNAETAIRTLCLKK